MTAQTVETVESVPSADFTYTTTRGELLPILEALALATTSKYLPAGLRGVLIDPMNLTLTTTDYDTTVTAKGPGVVSYDMVAGSPDALVSLPELLDAVKIGGKSAKALRGEVTLYLSDGLATVETGGVTVSLTVLDLAEYPRIPAITSPESFKVRAEELRDAWAVVAVACDTGPYLLPVLNAVHVVTDGTQAVLMATDRYRLHEATLNLTGICTKTPGEPVDILIPFKAGKVLKYLSDIVHVTVGPLDHASQRSITFKDARLTVTMILCSGEFPKVAAIWPTTGDGFTFDRDQLLASVKALKGQGGKNVPIRFRAEDGALHPSVTDGDRVASGPVVKVDGTALDFAVNPGFLADILTAMPAGALWMGHTSSTRPFLFSTHRNSFRAVLMPVRFSQ